MSSDAITLEQRAANRHRMVWVPLQCELAGCAETGGLKRCAKCALVYYCGAEHQAADWRRHRAECSHLARLALVSLPYSPAAELARRPLGGGAPTARGEPRACGICSETRASILERTECCGEWVCNREDEYVLMSYSRAFCSRSHRRYTRCGFHAEEGHEGDWRACERCASEGARGVVDWHASNGYNFTPGPRPQGMLYTEQCVRCGVRIATGWEASGFGGSVRGTQCGKCINADL